MLTKRLITFFMLAIMAALCVSGVSAQDTIGYISVNSEQIVSDWSEVGLNKQPIHEQFQGVAFNVDESDHPVEVDLDIASSDPFIVRVYQIVNTKLTTKVISEDLAAEFKGEFIAPISGANVWVAVKILSPKDYAAMTANSPTNNQNANGNNSAQGDDASSEVYHPEEHNPIGWGGSLDFAQGDVWIVSVWCNGTGPTGNQPERTWMINDMQGKTSIDLQPGCNGDAYKYDAAHYALAITEGRIHAQDLGAPFMQDNLSEVPATWGLNFAN